MEPTRPDILERTNTSKLVLGMPIELRNSIVDEKPEADCCRGTISLPQRKIVLFANGRIVLAKLPSVIDAVIAAVRNGELAEQLAQASLQAKTPKSKVKRSA